MSKIPPPAQQEPKQQQQFPFKKRKSVGAIPPASELSNKFIHNQSLNQQQLEATGAMIPFPPGAYSKQPVKSMTQQMRQQTNLFSQSVAQSRSSQRGVSPRTIQNIRIKTSRSTRLSGGDRSFEIGMNNPIGAPPPPLLTDPIFSNKSELLLHLITILEGKLASQIITQPLGRRINTAHSSKQQYKNNSLHSKTVSVRSSNKPLVTNPEQQEPPQIAWDQAHNQEELIISQQQKQEYQQQCFEYNKYIETIFGRFHKIFFPPQLTTSLKSGNQSQNLDFQLLKQQGERLIEQATALKIKTSTLYEKIDTLQTELNGFRRENNNQQSVQSLNEIIQKLRTQNGILRSEKLNLEVSNKSQANVTAIMEKKLADAIQQKQHAITKMKQMAESDIAILTKNVERQGQFAQQQLLGGDSRNSILLSNLDIKNVQIRSERMSPEPNKSSIRDSPTLGGGGGGGGVPPIQLMKKELQLQSIKNNVMESSFQSLTKHKFYIIKQLKVFKKSIQSTFSDIKQQFTRMEGVDSGESNLALISIAKSQSNIERLHNHSQKMFDKAMELISLLHTDVKNEAQYDIQIEEEPQIGEGIITSDGTNQQKKKGILMVKRNSNVQLSGNQLSQSCEHRLEEVLVMMTQFISEMHHAIGHSLHADITHLNSSLITKLRDYHLVERLFEKYCKNVLAKYNDQKMKYEARINELQNQCKHTHEQLNRIKLAFQAQTFKVAQQAQEKNVDTLLIKRLQEQIVRQNQLQARCQTLQKLKSDISVKLTMQLISTQTHRQQIERHYKAMVQMKDIQNKEIISKLHSDLFQQQMRLNSIEEERESSQKQLIEEIKQLRATNQSKQSDIEIMKSELQNQIDQLKMNLELYKQNFEQEKLNDQMVRGCYRKFDNTFTVAFQYEMEDPECDDDFINHRVNSDKIILYLKMMLRLPDDSIRLVSVHQRNFNFSQLEGQETQMGSVLIRYLFELNPSFEKVISPQSDKKIKRLINSLLTAAKSGTSLLYQINPIFVSRNIGRVSSGHCPNFDEYYLLSRQVQQFTRPGVQSHDSNKIQLILSIYKHPNGFIKVLGLDVKEQQQYELNLNEEEVLLLSKQNIKIFQPSFTQLLKTLILTSLNFVVIDGKCLVVAEAKEFFTQTPLAGFISGGGGGVLNLKNPAMIELSSSLKLKENNSGGVNGPLNKLIPSTFPMRGDKYEQVDFPDLQFQSLARLTKTLYCDEQQFELNDSKFKIMVEVEKEITNNLVVSLIARTRIKGQILNDGYSNEEYYPLCLLHGSNNSSEFLLKQSSSIIGIGGERYLWFVESRSSDKILIIKFLTLRRRSDLCTGIVLVFQESISGAFVLQQRVNTIFDSVDENKLKSMNQSGAINQFGQIVIKIGIGSGSKNGQPFILPDISPSDQERRKQSQDIENQIRMEKPLRYSKPQQPSSLLNNQNLLHSELCFLENTATQSFELRQLVFSLQPSSGDLVIICTDIQGKVVIPSREIIGMDLLTLIRIFLSNTQFIKIENGDTLNIYWKSIIQNQQIIEIQPMKLSLSSSSLSFDVAQLPAIDTITSYISLKRRIFKSMTKFIAEMPSQGSINEALLSKYAQWKIVVIMIESRVLKKYFSIIFTEKDIIQLLIGLGYSQIEFATILNDDHDKLSALLIRSLYFEDDVLMNEVCASVMLAQERDGKIKSLKDCVEINGVFSGRVVNQEQNSKSRDELYKSPENFHTDDPYSSLKSKILSVKHVGSFKSLNEPFIVRLIQVQYIGRLQFRIEVEQSQGSKKIITGFTFASSCKEQKFKVGLYSAKLFNDSFLVNLTVVEDSFPHKVVFALSNNQGDVIWKYELHDSSVNEILASSSKSSMLKTLLNYFNDDDFFNDEKKATSIDRFKKSNEFNKINRILDSAQEGLVKLERDQHGVYVSRESDNSKSQYIGVNNLATNSSVLILESIDGDSKFGVFMSGKFKNDSNIGTFTSFSTSILSSVSDKKKKSKNIISLLQYHSLMNSKIVGQQQIEQFGKKQLQKSMQFLLASFEFSPSTQGLKKYCNDEGLILHTKTNIKINRIKIGNYQSIEKELSCLVSISMLDLGAENSEEKPAIIEIRATDIENHKNSQEMYVAVDQLLGGNKREIEQFRKEIIHENIEEIKDPKVRDMIISATKETVQIIKSKDDSDEISFILELKQRQEKNKVLANEGERLLTLFSDFKLLDTHDIIQEQFGKFQVQVFEKMNIENRSTKEYVVKVWNPETFKMMSKITLNSSQIEGIRDLVRKGGEGKNQGGYQKNVGTFLIEHIFLKKKDENMIEIIFN